MGEKVGHLIFALSAIVAGIIISLCVGPLFALSAFAYFPLVLLSLGIFAKFIKFAF